MKLHELIISGAIGALLAAAGIKTMSPELKEKADEVTFFATVKDRNLVIMSEITGRNLFEGMSSAISPDEIRALAEEMKAAGTIQGTDFLTPEVITEANAAVTRWNSTQNN